MFGGFNQGQTNNFTPQQTTNIRANISQNPSNLVALVGGSAKRRVSVSQVSIAAPSVNNKDKDASIAVVGTNTSDSKQKKKRNRRYGRNRKGIKGFGPFDNQEKIEGFVRPASSGVMNQQQNVANRIDLPFDNRNQGRAFNTPNKNMPKPVQLSPGNQQKPKPLLHQENKPENFRFTGK